MMIPDSPIDNFADDRLDREKFVEQLSVTIKNSHPDNALTIGIYGSWGSGKSSVLNLLEKKISGNPNVEVIRFDPWFFNSEEGIIYGLFGIIKSSISSLIPKMGTREKLSFNNLMGEYSNFLSIFNLSVGIPLNLIPVKLSMDFKGLKKTRSVEIVRKGLREKFLLIRSKVCILIDNIDRLDSKEALLIFKLIRACLDFPNLIFVVAFDKNKTQQLLKNSLLIDEDFIEKIVQLDINLPQIKENKLDDVLSSYIQSLCDQHDVNQDDFITAEFRNLYILYFRERVFNSIRCIKRFINALNFSVPILKNEVNYGDLLLVEILRVFFPSIYQLIPCYKKSLTEVDYPPLSGHDYRQDERFPSYKDLISKTEIMLADAKDALIVRRIIAKLFPSFSAYIDYPNNPPHILDSEQTNEKFQHICSETFFSRYFQFDVSINDIPTGEVNIIISKINSDKNPEPEVIESFREYQLCGKLKLLFEKLLIFSDKLSVIGKRNVIEILLQNNDFLNWGNKYSWSSEGTQAIDLCLSCLLDIDNTIRYDFIVPLLQNSTSIIFNLSLFHKLLKDNTQLYFNDSQKTEIKDLIHEQIQSEFITKKVNIFTRYPESHWRILSAWKAKVFSDSPDEVTKYLDETFLTSPESIPLFLSSFNSVKMGTLVPADFHYDDLKKWYDPANLYTLITKSNPQANDENSRFALSEFVKIHKKLLD